MLRSWLFLADMQKLKRTRNSLRDPTAALTCKRAHKFLQKRAGKKTRTESPQFTFQDFPLDLHFVEVSEGVALCVTVNPILPTKHLPKYLPQGAQKSCSLGNHLCHQGGQHPCKSSFSCEDCCEPFKLVCIINSLSR